MLGAFAEMNVDLVLCGHDHQEAIHYVEHTRKGTVISTAGTVSNRMRGGRPSSVNSITITPKQLEVASLVWSTRIANFCRRASEVLRTMSTDPAPGPGAARPRLRPAPAGRGGAVHVLCGLGLRTIRRCRLTRNRNVMVSFGGGELRVHEGYLNAPTRVLEAIVMFVEGRTRAERRAAQQTHRRIPGPHARGRPCAASARIPDDEPIVDELAVWHRRYNMRHFNGRLKSDRHLA